jgi:hypothetical protein
MPFVQGRAQARPRAAGLRALEHGNWRQAHGVVNMGLASLAKGRLVSSDEGRARAGRVTLDPVLTEDFPFASAAGLVQPALSGARAR